jgi:UDP-glucose/GDP-mannose dehydrogenase family, UDP binding domain
MHYTSSPYEAAEGADAVLILTDWPEFAHLDLPRLRKTMRFPVILDGRNLYKPAIMLEHGFTYLSIGRSAAHGLLASNQREAVVDLPTPPLSVASPELEWQPRASS